MKNLPFRGALAAALLAAAPTAPASDVADYLLLQSVEERMASVGYRLAVSARELCADQAALAGIQLHDASQYGRGEAEALGAAFGAGPWPKVLALAKDGAAARAGVKPNDSVLAIDDRPVPPAAGARSYARMWAALALLEQGLADGHAVLTLERDGKPLTVDVTGERGCASRFQLKIARGLQGQADGDYVEVTSGLVAFAPDDAELAAAIAHELAHNILRHRARLDAAGVSRGLLQQFGKNARLTRETEIEADRLSVHLLDRAGYPMRAALSFWERFRKAIFTFGDATHPGARTRMATISVEIARIEAAKATGKVPVFEP